MDPLITYSRSIVASALASAPPLEDENQAPLTAENSHLAVVQVPLSRYGDDEDRALTCAARDGHPEVVLILLKQYGADISTASKGAALVLSANNGHLEIVSILLNKQYGANISEASKDRAIRWAAKNGHFEVVSILLKQCGADISAASKSIVLMCAAGDGHLEVLSILLTQYEADIAGDKGQALGTAAECGHSKAVSMLLTRRGVDISADDIGRALKDAAIQDHPEVISMLLEQCGADISETDKGVVIRYAAKRGHLATLNVLLAEGSWAAIAARLAAQNRHTDIITTRLDSAVIIRTINEHFAISSAKQNERQASLDILLANLMTNTLFILPEEINLIMAYLGKHDGRLLDKKRIAHRFNKAPDIVKLKHRFNGEQVCSAIKAEDDSLFALDRNCIGVGAYGKAKLAQNLDTGELCVAKIQKENSIPGSPEITILKKFNHLLQYQKRATKEYLFIKFIPGCTLARLRIFLDDFGLELTPLEQLKLMRSMLQSIKILKENDIQHNDLHSRNIMIHPTLEVTIIDFGLSKFKKNLTLEVGFFRGALKRIFSMAELSDMIKNLKNITSPSRKEIVLEHLNQAILKIDALVQQYNKIPCTTSRFEELVTKDRRLISELEALKESKLPDSPTPIDEAVVQGCHTAHTPSEVISFTGALSRENKRKRSLSSEAASSSDPKGKRRCGKR